MSALRKNLGFAQGLALYLAAVLGTGILVIPLLAWREAGPASLIAWGILGFLGLSLAWTFAEAGAKYPDAGGIQFLISKVFGRASGTLTRWLVFFCIPAGAVAASHIFAEHFAATFLIPDSYVPWIAWGALVLVFAANYFGLRLSANTQLGLSGLLVVLLTVFLILAFPHVKEENFSPFSPKGYSGVADTMVLIFWAFLGWESIAHLAEEFRNPKKDMIRAAVVAAILVGFFYFSLSFVLIGVGIFKAQTQGIAPLVSIAQEIVGAKGRIFTGLIASVVCLGTMNVYTAGLSRLGYSMAKAKDFPKWLGYLDSKTGTPRNSLLLLFFMFTLALATQAIFDIPLRIYFLIPNLAYLLLYVLGCISTARLLQGRSIAVKTAYSSALICAAMIPFATEVLFVPALVLIGAITYIAFQKQRFRKNNKAKLKR